VNIVHANEETFDDLVYAPRGRLVVAYFWGVDCPNCELFATRLPVLEQALAGSPVTLVKTDVYTHPAIARRFGLYGIPAFLLVRDGVKLGMMRQFHGDGYWLSVIREHLPQTATQAEKS